LALRKKNSIHLNAGKSGRAIGANMAGRNRTGNDRAHAVDLENVDRILFQPGMDGDAGGRPTPRTGGAGRGRWKNPYSPPEKRLGGNAQARGKIPP
jgi:hypothetical protein